MSLAPQPPGALAVDHVSRSFGARRVVDDVSFEAPPGGVTVLVGPSGCGKTTLLRMIAGIERPSGGRILIDGQEMAGTAVFVPPERRRIGLMFQDYALFPHLTVRENVMFGLGALPPAERRRIAEEAVARVGLSAHIEARPGRLSGGEQQRLALARSLAPSPRILLMDEPFSNLDRGLREEVRARTLAVLREAGVTTLLVTHDPEEALSIGDHLVLLESGRVIQSGPAASLYARPVCIAAARALSDVNLVSGRVRNGILDTPLGAVAAPDAPEASEGLAGFRPEHLSIGPTGEGLSGRVERRAFLGASTLLTIRVPGLAEPLRVLVPTVTAPDGPEVGVHGQTAAAMVFSASDGKIPQAARRS